ncbi:MAG: Gfo/Idh/MocA family oxidoreductase [Candidatus Hydrogenedentes bacterium]|nr:Gfo/Idh/MocA family oxidoreductase [Candidatus Hydrogenedentota bacterium]
MSNELSRRNFMKATGAVAGVAIASGYSPFAYAQNEKVRVAIIGAGAQNIFHIEHGIAGTPEIEIVAIADCVRFGQIRGWDAAGRKEEMKEHLYYDYRVMLEKEKDNIDAVVIATPYKTHYPIVMDCLDAGKWVFCEKTMAHEYELCRNIVTKCHETGKFVQCGHQRRYNPDYLQAVKLLQEGKMGRITFIEAQWHRNGDWRTPLPKKKDGSDVVLNEEEVKLVKDLGRLVNWRIYEEYSAGVLSELATHHVECVNWIMGKAPSRVYTTGGTDYWRDDRDTADNVTLVYEYDLRPGDHGFGTISKRSNYQELTKINRPYTVRFTWSGLLTSFHKGESILLIGDQGAMELRERIKIEEGQKTPLFHPEPTLIWLDPKTMEPTTDEEIINYIKTTNQSRKYTRLQDHPSVPFNDFLEPGAFDIEPDARQFQAFVHHIKNGGKPRTNEMCGMMAAVCDIAADEALKTKQVVKIDPAVWKFDFETPDPFELGV